MICDWVRALMSTICPVLLFRTDLDR